MFNSKVVQISMELWGAIICIIFSSFIVLANQKGSRRNRYLLYFLQSVALLLLSDSAAWYYRGNETTLGYYMVRISNYLVFVLNYFLGFFLLRYMDIILHEKGSRVHPVLKFHVYFIGLVGIALVTISQYTGYLYSFDEHNLYSRGDGFLVISIVAALMLVFMLSAIIANAKKLTRLQYVPLLLIYLLALTADVIQILFYGISLVNIAIMVGVMVLFFAYEKEQGLLRIQQEKEIMEKTLSMVQQQAELAKKDAELAQKDVQLTEKRTQIMLSQIQPHFLYNTLSAISFLCIKDPMKAKQTVDYLSSFLRINLGSLQSEQMVPFRQELEHTNAYLWIEQVRFGDDLAVEFDIGCDDFRLPSLSLQPIVENAVRHGICGKEDGGTVTIKTMRSDGNITILVVDDGIGFDTTKKPSDDRIHVGMENVRTRIGLLCGGSMAVSSCPGLGTTVTITIPDSKE